LLDLASMPLDHAVYDPMRRMGLTPTGIGDLARYHGPDYVERHATVRRGDRFARLLKRYDVPTLDAPACQRSALLTFHLSRVRPKRSLTLYFDRHSDDLAAVEYAIDRRELLVVEKSPDGEIFARRVALVSSVELRAVSGRIGENVSTDCSEAGVPERIVSE